MVLSKKQEVSRVNDEVIEYLIHREITWDTLYKKLKAQKKNVDDIYAEFLCFNADTFHYSYKQLHQVGKEDSILEFYPTREEEPLDIKVYMY